MLTAGELGDAQVILRRRVPWAIDWGAVHRMPEVPARVNNLPPEQAAADEVGHQPETS